jgi:hypothetical protein
MKERIFILFCGVLLMFFSLSLVYGQNVLVWNNDRGESKQEYPDVAKWKDGWTLVVWQEQRRGNYDIWGQIFDETGKPYKDNFLVNEGLTKGRQISASVSCFKDGDWAIVVWQSNETGDQEDICGQRVGKDGSLIGDLFIVNDFKEYDQMAPEVAVERISGYYAVVWTDNRDEGSGSAWDIYSRHFDIDGQPINKDFRVNREDKLNQIRGDVSVYLLSKAAVIACYTWQDHRNNVNGDIYMRRFTMEETPNPVDTDDIPVVDEEMADSYDQRFPVITNSAIGDMACVWQDDRPRQKGRGDRASYSIYMQLIGEDGVLLGKNSYLTLDPSGEQLRPSAASKSDGWGIVTWYDYRNGDWDIYGNKIFIKEDGGPYGSNIQFATLQNDQIFPMVAVDDGPEHISTTWMDYQNPQGLWDIYYRLTDYATGEHITDPIEVGKLFGVRAVYDDDEDYDKPTPYWNEDPRVDNVYSFETAKAVVDMLTENNIDGYWSIVESETLPGRRNQDASIFDYDLVIIDLGWRRGAGLSPGATSAGTMTQEERDDLVAYINGGDPVVMLGNDFGYDYDTTDLYDLFSISWISDGLEWTTGNVETLKGQNDRFTRGMNLTYNYQDTCDNYVDRFDIKGTGMEDTIFIADNPQKVYFLCGSAYSFAWKGGGGKAPFTNLSHLSISMSGLVSDDHPNTSIELTRRLASFAGLRVAPEPITTLLAEEGPNEGEVILTWTAPLNQNVTTPDKATGYTLKFTKCTFSPPDSGKLSDDAEFEAAPTYYQTWSPESGGDAEEETLRGLPPGQPLIFAIKAYDTYSGETRNSTLGDEPMDTISGDTVTPHTIYIGNDSKGGGYVKDFLDNEIMGVRSSDTLCFTWDASNLYVGYSRNNWTGGGDFYVFFDVEPGGADSTYPEQSGKRNALPPDFHGDYCFRVSTASAYGLHAHNGSYTWYTSTTTWTGDFSEDDVVNSSQYTEFSIPFSNLGYDPSDPFKFLAICQNESNNSLWNSFPTENNVGKTTDLYYYYYFDRLGSGMSPGDTVVALELQLSAFTAMSGIDGVELRWRTEGEHDIYQWIVEREDGEEFREIGRLNGSGNSQVPQDYQFKDENVIRGETYTYRLQSLDSWGNRRRHGTITVQFTPLYPRIPSLFAISPNPVCAQSQIQFSIPNKSFVNLRVLDVSGRVVETVVNEMRDPGIYTESWPRKRYGQGIYFIELQCEGERVVEKVTILR